MKVSVVTDGEDAREGKGQMGIEVTQCQFSRSAWRNLPSTALNQCVFVGATPHAVLKATKEQAVIISSAAVLLVVMVEGVMTMVVSRAAAEGDEMYVSIIRTG